MKRKFAILLLLLATTGIFSWSSSYYQQKYVELHDKALIMEYQVLDSDVWKLEQREKQQLLSQDASFEELRPLQQEASGAESRSKIGYWIAILAGMATAAYAFYFFWFLIYVELIQKEGYRDLYERIKKVAKKVGESSALPKK